MKWWFRWYQTNPQALGGEGWRIVLVDRSHGQNFWLWNKTHVAGSFWVGFKNRRVKTGRKWFRL